MTNPMQPPWHRHNYSVRSTGGGSSRCLWREA
eukprot:CAMPEP_0204336044 /NCGR_PEP_ID=MMETSP0469-20131031/19251_1 /ASSEMBLY_ACC=CAM_ASM_000384 /TAXON_ID=2969 /ORGANISM="Oxyrrhis marina" /LENGTH=31 /DNA_ID= /DNA_START= /DNA_END= /DNA_ORIENTATION=